MGQKKLLVADDSLTIQKVIRLALANEGFEIQAVSNGDEAIQQIPLFRPDIVLIDVSLPNKSAFEVKQEFNGDSTFVDVKFILMSSAFEQIDETKASQVKFHGRLIKPFDPAHLRKVIQSVTPPVTSTSPSMETRPQRTQTPKNLDLPSARPSDNFAPAPGLTPDDDIRKLTEATIKISGLENLDWSVNESAAKKPTVIGEKTFSDIQDVEPTLKPIPGLLDIGESTFQLNGNPESQAPLEEISFDELPQTFPKEEITFEDPTPTLAPSFTPNPFSVQTPPPVAATAPVTAPTITAQQMEEMISRQLETVLEKMLQKTIPEIAERVIRSEIHKLLSEPPTN